MRVIVLGSGQDGGIPQVGTAGAVADPRTASSIALVGDSGDVVIFDVGPDLRSQWPRIADRRLRGVFLTHAHMGHYTGLVHFGPEAAATDRLPVHGSRRMLTFLETNEPWAGLFQAGHLLAEALDPDVPVAPLDGPATVTATPVPHRGTLTDTLAFSIRTPARSLLYVPDVDTWEGWDAFGLVAAHDVALVDGTFWSASEPPGRRYEEVPHPPIEASLDRFAAVAGGVRIVFTHLNHSNPAGTAGDAAREVERRGFEVAVDGMEIDLGAG